MKVKVINDAPTIKPKEKGRFYISCYNTIVLCTDDKIHNSTFKGVVVSKGDTLLVVGEIHTAHISLYTLFSGKIEIEQ